MVAAVDQVAAAEEADQVEVVDEDVGGIGTDLLAKDLEATGSAAGKGAFWTPRAIGNPEAAAGESRRGQLMEEYMALLLQNTAAFTGQVCCFKVCCANSPVDLNVGCIVPSLTNMAITHKHGKGSWAKVSSNYVDPRTRRE